MGRSAVIGKSKRRFEFEVEELLYAPLAAEAAERGESIAALLKGLIAERYGLAVPPPAPRSGRPRKERPPG